jgi:hypothetical protein
MLQKSFDGKETLKIIVKTLEFKRHAKNSSPQQETVIASTNQEKWARIFLVIF